MNERDQFGHQETLTKMGPVQSPSTDGPLQGQYRFSPEEMRVLKECNRESFFTRSLPIGTFLGLGTYSAIQRGILKTNPRFGVFPKVTVAVIVGYFVGKLSYQQACAEKLMALPNSYIGQVLRDRKEGRTTVLPKQPPTMFGANQSDIYSDAGPGSSLDLDTDRPLFTDDSYRPDRDNGGNIDLQEPNQPRTTLSYEDLRRKNRSEYSDARQDPYKMDIGPTPPISRARTSPAPPTSAPSAAHPINKYGDVME